MSYSRNTEICLKKEADGNALFGLISEEDTSLDSRNETGTIQRLVELEVSTPKIEIIDLNACLDPISDVPSETCRPPALHCKACGVILTPKNTSETRKGSGRLRSKCKKCTRRPYYKRKKPKVTKLVSKWFTIIISTTQNRKNLPAFVERHNPVHQAVQTFIQICTRCGQSTYESDVLFCPGCGRVDLQGMKCHYCSHILRFARKCPNCGIATKTIGVEKDLVCIECGNVVRYDSKRNKVCDGCGLITTVTDAEIMEHVRIRKPGRRAVDFHRDSEWKRLEYDDGGDYDQSYQPHLWFAPKNRGEKVIPDTDPADVPNNDGELLSSIQKNGIVKPDGLIKSDKPAKLTKKQRKARTDQLRAMFEYIKKPVKAAIQKIGLWELDTSWGLWDMSINF